MGARSGFVIAGEVTMWANAGVVKDHGAVGLVSLIGGTKPKFWRLGNSRLRDELVGARPGAGRWRIGRRAARPLAPATRRCPVCGSYAVVMRIGAARRNGASATAHGGLPQPYRCLVQLRPVLLDGIVVA